MVTLPFHHIQHIEQILEQVELADLVLISRDTEGCCQLVYNRPLATLPADVPQLACKSYCLDTLAKQPELYRNSVGPIVGFAALELLLPDLPTYGINFYTIDRLFQQPERLGILQRTSYQLACSLLAKRQQHLSDTEEWGWDESYTRIVELALPMMLAKQNLEHLVAVVLDSSRPEYFLDPARCHLIYNLAAHPQDLIALTRLVHHPARSCVVAFEELGLFHPKLSQAIRADLRVTLRRMQSQHIQKLTCHSLALRCWQAWQTTGQRPFRNVAYALAAEAWLIDEDVEDLIALVAHRDFLHFANDGLALRIYRVPPVAHYTPGLQCHVETVVNWPADDLSYAAPALSLPVLAPVLQRLSVNEHQDILPLGPVLWKSNHIHELARTFWLLSRDLLHHTLANQAEDSVWLRFTVKPQAVTDLAIRSALIYGISDPWRWRQGRYEIFLRGCYAHVRECLLQQMKHYEGHPLMHYYQALNAWYSYAAGDPQPGLSSMVRACQAFQEHCQPADALGRECATAEQMVEIGERLLFPDREWTNHSQYLQANADNPISVTDYLRMLMDSSQPTHEPSQLFAPIFRQYCIAHAHWRRLQRALPSKSPAPAELHELLAEYQQLQRMTHVPHHELVLLQQAYALDIEQIQRLQRLGDAEPLIQIRLLNPWVTRHKRERLIVQLENLGSSHVDHVRVILHHSAGFELLSDTHILDYEALAPGASWRFAYDIRAQESELLILIDYSYRDLTARMYQKQESIPVEVHTLTAGLTRTMSNPYEVGRPVSGVRRFFGRRAELELILTRLSKGSTQPLLLRGPRRIGKTSLIKRVEAVLRDRTQRQQLDLPAEIEATLGTIFPISVSLQSIDPQVENYSIYFLQMIIQRICQILGIQPGAALNTNLANWRLPAHTFLEQIDWILQQRPTMRLFILIDEWDDISKDKFDNLGRTLRHIVQEEQRISWAFSSTWTISAEVGRFGSPWFNILDRIELKGLEWEAAAQLVLEPSEGIGVDWMGEAVVTILDQTGQRPYLIQLLCSRIIDYLNQRRLRVIEPETVKDVVNMMIVDTAVTGQYLGFLWDDASWMAHLIVWALDYSLPAALTKQQIWRIMSHEHYQRFQKSFDMANYENQFSEAITWLYSVADAVALRGEHYSFSFPLVQRWLHHIISQREEQITLAFSQLTDFDHQNH